MQTHLLKTLLKISQVQSFALAAEHLNMTLSAVSMQMKSLEEQLDASLFDRKFRPPKLTPLGLAVAEKAQAVVDEDYMRASELKKLVDSLTLERDSPAKESPKKFSSPSKSSPNKSPTGDTDIEKKSAATKKNSHMKKDHDDDPSSEGETKGDTTITSTSKHFASIANMKRSLKRSL